MSATKARVAAPAVTEGRTLGITAKLGGLLLLGLLIRLAFIGSAGFKNDVSSFEAWAIALASHPLAQFYNPKEFADYPPGYFYVLAFIGHVYAVLAPSGNLGLLKALIKLPAICFDLIDGVLLFAIVRRFASERWAMIAAALFVLNPAVIFISAAWGQVDSISGGLALAAVYLLLRAQDDEGEHRFSWPVFAAWLALGYSLLIKPQAAVLAPVFIAFAFLSAERRRARLVATVAGIAAAIVLAWALAFPFHPVANPVAVMDWLIGRYAIGKNVYPYSSANAFNLWSILRPFWQPDSQHVAFLPQYVWGILLVAAAEVLVIVRYVQVRSERALIEAAAMVTLAFFILATRMHERYIFDGLIFTIASIPFAVRYVWASIIYSCTLFVNLIYSLVYLGVVLNATPGVNAANMWPAVTHPLSVINVAVLFWLGFVYLGDERSFDTRAPRVTHDDNGRQLAVLRVAARNWFNPREGLAAMVWPLDYALAAAIGCVSFVLSYINYWYPREKVFDEIYFARAAEEYLTHRYIYENTHPPLTKLIITLSTMLFGGMHGGDNSHGWRFLDVVFGAIAVVVLYALAKRITRSTAFSTLAAIFFTADGMHFVQSRIATPEGIVVVFALGSLYAFYRYWIASQSTVRRLEPDTVQRVVISSVCGLFAGYAVSAGVTIPFGQDRASFVVVGLYCSCAFYLAMRLWILPKIRKPAGTFISYADGTTIREDGSRQLALPDGRTIDLRRKSKASNAIEEGELKISYDREGAALYETPDGSARFTPGLLVDDCGESQQGRHATAWLIAFTVLLGMLVASKWYGVMAYGVSFVVIAAVWLQRYWAVGRPKLWGNPFGFRIDIALAAIALLSMTVYALVWVPDFFRQIEIHNLNDLMYRQYSMFQYHDTLRATHPYASAWWTWPIDLRPIAYYWKDLRTGAGTTSPSACCVAEIVSMPNPLILWFGLFCVPCIAYLAWRERNKGYALLIVAYLLQWLPWARSPRITFIYHFYVDVPIIVLCNVIVLQRIWEWASAAADAKTLARIAVGAYALAVVVAFAFFYPILAGTPIVWNDWESRMWIQRWVI